MFTRGFLMKFINLGKHENPDCILFNLNQFEYIYEFKEYSKIKFKNFMEFNIENCENQSLDFHNFLKDQRKVFYFEQYEFKISAIEEI